jgi:hypothetical protein
MSVLCVMLCDLHYVKGRSFIYSGRAHVNMCNVTRVAIIQVDDGF